MRRVVVALLAFLFLAGCKSAGEPAQSRTPNDPHAGRVAAQPAPAPERRPLQSRPEEKQALSASPYVVVLPSDSAFVGAPLPERDPERYRAWAQMARLWVGKSHLQEAAFLDDERLILARSSMESGVRLYERSSQRLLAQHDLKIGNFASVALLPWSAQGPEALFLLGSERGLQLYDARTGTLLSKLSERKVTALRWSADGNVLVACVTPSPAQPSSLWFFRRAGARGLDEVGSVPLFGRVEGWDLTRDNRLLAVSLYPQEAVVLIDLHTGAGVGRVPAPIYAGDISFSPDGRWLAVGGQGLLLIDVANPARRAFYSHYHNNIARVRFSPSGDVLATSSYDGHIRLFSYDAQGPTLQLVKTLRHEGTANVYAIEFGAAGNDLLSSSGDQTLRLFGATPRSPAVGLERGRFRSLTEWKTSLPRELLAEPLAPRPSMKDGHYHPPQLDAPPRPAKIRPGLYACRVASMYKLRDCTVQVAPSGHTLLEFHEGNLVSLKGVLYDDGPVLRYEAWQTDESTVIGCQGCEQQPLHAVFRGTGGNFQGLLLFRNYYDPLLPPPLPEANVRFEEAADRYPLTLTFKRPLPAPKPGHDAIAVPTKQ